MSLICKITKSDYHFYSTSDTNRVDNICAYHHYRIDNKEDLEISLLKRILEGDYCCKNSRHSLRDLVNKGYFE